MEQTKINNPAVINDLIQINNDRVAGYKKAIEIAAKLNITDLDDLFARNIRQSLQFNEELAPYVEVQGEEPTDSTMLSGKLFRLWMDIKAAVSGEDRKSLLASCEKGEDAFKKVYKEAIDNKGDDLSVDLLALIQDQLNTQLQAHDEIKFLRDAE